MLVNKAMDDLVNLYRNTVQRLAFWFDISKLDPYSMLVYALFKSIELGFNRENTIQC